MLRWIPAVALVGLLSASSLAEESFKSEFRSADAQLADYARANPSCISFTDYCRTCVRTSDQKFHCSMPGIACIRQVWSCTQHSR
jgi:hypothetical protein